MKIVPSNIAQQASLPTKSTASTAALQTYSRNQLGDINTARPKFAPKPRQQVIDAEYVDVYLPSNSSSYPGERAALEAALEAPQPKQRQNLPAAYQTLSRYQQRAADETPLPGSHLNIMA